MSASPHKIGLFPVKMFFAHAAFFLSCVSGTEGHPRVLAPLKEYMAMQIEEEEKAGESNVQLRDQG